MSLLLGVWQFLTGSISMENNALYSKSLVLPVTRFVSEMLLELRSSGLLLRSPRFRLECVRQLGFSERESG